MQRRHSVSHPSIPKLVCDEWVQQSDELARIAGQPAAVTSVGKFKMAHERESIIR
jgi:hypothetical protein